MTDGSDDHQKDLAALGGNFVKKALGWPNKLTQAESKRVTELKEEIERLRARLPHQGPPAAAYLSGRL